MSNRVIKDSIWTSPSLAQLPLIADLSWPRWLLLSDDWGCFEADAEVIKGKAYPKRKEVKPSDIEKLKTIYNESGNLFLWKEGGREWGYFTNFDTHNEYCNSSGVNDVGKYTKHRRKTPEPPKDLLNEYLIKLSDKFRQVPTKSLNPNSVPNPEKIPPTPQRGGPVPRPDLSRREKDLNRTSVNPAEGILTTASDSTSQKGRDRLVFTEDNPLPTADPGPAKTKAEGEKALTKKLSGCPDLGLKRKHATESREKSELFKNPKFAEAWKLWEKHRAELRRPLTPSTICLQLKMLENEPDAVAIIFQSIQSGWQGLFPLKTARRGCEDKNFTRSGGIKGPPGKYDGVGFMPKGN